MVATPFLKYAVQPRPEGRDFDTVHVLLILQAQLFLLSFENAQVPADWNVTEATPLYKKGPMLDPKSNRMLAVSGTMYRLYANVIRYLFGAYEKASGHTVWFLPLVTGTLYSPCSSLLVGTCCTLLASLS